MIAIGCDHGGFHLKQAVLQYLQEKGYEYQDFGCFDTKSVDYPDFALPVAEAVAAGKAQRGILICGTGVGVSMVANKVPGIRASLCGDTFSARATREHNDANILTMGERVTGPGLALDILDVWLHTDFIGGRHAARVDKIRAVEQKYCKTGEK